MKGADYLGGPFLATGQTLIDVLKGLLTMQVNNEKVTFNVFNTMKYPNDGVEKCHEMIETLEVGLTEEEEENEEKEDDEEMNEDEEDIQFVGKRIEEIEPLMLHERIALSQKPSLEVAPSIELKPLSVSQIQIFGKG